MDVLPALFLEIFSFFLFQVARADVFSSSSQLTRLSQLEQTLVVSVEAYLIQEEKRLNKIRQDLVQLKTQLPDADQNFQDYAGNPINAFTMIKRCVTDWALILNDIIGNANGAAFQENLVKSGIAWPTEADLDGAAAGLLRLQRTYKLATTDIINGRISHQTTQGLSPGDCYDIGRLGILQYPSKHAVEWLNYALDEGKKRTSNGDNVTYGLVDTMLYLGDAYSVLQETGTAVKITEEALLMDPDNKLIQERLPYLRSLNNSRHKNLKNETNSSATSDDYKFRDVYEALCRGDDIQDRRVRDKLYCQYKKGAFPYRPTKEEVLYLSPRISILYDVISEEESEKIKQLAMPDFIRAEVGGNESFIDTNVRTGQLGWLWDNDPDPLVKKVAKRVSEITGFDTTHREKRASAEALQVVNYGIGGQYEPHHDFFERKIDLDSLPSHLLNTGDRMATFMFYLNTVEAGGATVFPEVKVRVPAIKNAAAFWYNIKKSGDRDYKTTHAGCPVLLGHKWVANKWIREFGQEFRRPCGLVPSELD